MIDGDIFRYRCAFAAERTKYLVELTNASNHKEYKTWDSKKEADQYGERVTKGSQGAFFVVWNRKDLQPLENCLQIVKSCLENTLDEIRSHFNVQQVDYSIWLSGKTNFRQAVATTRPYKGNRGDIPKPAYYRDVAAYLVEQWGGVYTEGIEADDALGIAAMAAKELGESYCIVSNDKDLGQIPGEHYNWVDKSFATVSSKDAKTRLFTQILSGDSTDNIPGLEGIGPAKAAKILEGAQSPEEMVDRVHKAYHDNYEATYPEMLEYLKEQWALVYILKRRTQDSTGGWTHEYWHDTKEGKYFIEKYG